MSPSREELAQKESDAWDAFLGVVATVPDDRRVSEGVVPGWSVKDLVWHCAEWTRFAGEHFEQMKEGTFVDPFAGVDDAHWDAVSQTMVDEARTMTWEEILACAEVRRTRARAVWESLPAIDDVAAHWLAEETFDHYDQHAEEIRAFLSNA